MNWLDFTLGLLLGLFIPPSAWFITVMAMEFRRASAARAEERERAKFSAAMQRKWETR